MFPHKSANIGIDAPLIKAKMHPIAINRQSLEFANLNIYKNETFLSYSLLAVFMSDYNRLVELSSFLNDTDESRC